MSEADNPELWGRLTRAFRVESYEKHYNSNGFTFHWKNIGGPTFTIMAVTPSGIVAGEPPPPTSRPARGLRPRRRGVLGHPLERSGRLSRGLD